MTQKQIQPVTIDKNRVWHWLTLAQSAKESLRDSWPSEPTEGQVAAAVDYLNALAIELSATLEVP